MRAKPERLFHFTCEDHGRPGIERAGAVAPSGLFAPQMIDMIDRIDPDMTWLTTVVWATDLAAPPRGALGIGVIAGACQRTVRFEVEADGWEWWPAWAARKIWKESSLPASAGELSFVIGAMPAHWYVTTGPKRIIR